MEKSQFSPLYGQMTDYIEGLQDTICAGLEKLDTATFKEDLWERNGGGGGRTRVIGNGSVLAKGGVNVSSVHGLLPESIANHLQTKPMQFAACGLSLVLHPGSPRIPTTHMNVRFFEMENGDQWFGGGIDLSPYYPHEEDFIHFHRTLKHACDSIDETLYPQYKKRCDEYFFLPHRNEMRGIGGIFFDYLKEDLPRAYELVRAVGDCFLEAYVPLIEKRREEPFDEEDRAFQLVRRGRYVEFNLVYDRGTLFGLKTEGRSESILMSLPPQVEFHYDWHPREGSPHAAMLEYYQPREYV